MNTRHFFLGLVIVAASSATAAHAQVLGGGVGGGLGGAMSGGLRNADVMTGGTLNGSLDSQLESGTLRRQTRDTLDRSTRHGRDGVGRIKQRTESGVAEAQSTASAATATAAGSATNAAPSSQIDSATNVAGSAAANAATNGMQSTGSANGAIGQAAQLQPSVNPSDGDIPQASAAENLASTVRGVDDAQPTSPGKDNAAEVLELPNAADSGQSENGSTHSLSSGLSSASALDGAGSSESLLAGDATDTPANSSALGSASAEGTASKERVSASGSAQGNANANVAMN